MKVTVADRGEGVPDEIASKIFDPYFTTKDAGSGLGLAISYSIVKKHGGLLQLENTRLKGLHFPFICRPPTEMPTEVPTRVV